MSNGVYEEVAEEDTFRSPVDRPIVLAGNFAELRQTHFHMGIDIKPQAANGRDSIRSVGHGYISRIRIQPGGYGHAVYLDHPNGYTSVYAHLGEIRTDVEQYISDWQKNLQSYSVDLYPSPSRFPLTKGEYIGMMGNTGHSYAKHLHFEIRETESETPINPALFGIRAKDTRPPTIQSVDIHRLSPALIPESERTYQPIHRKGNHFTIGNGKISFPAWRAGILIQAYDQLDGAPNRNGVYEKRMYVDDTLYFASIMNKISFDETRYINSYVHYPEKQSRKRTITRMYRLPGNPLSVYDTILGNGSIQLFKDQPRSIRIELKDVEGNTTTLSFDIVRDENIKSAEPFNNHHFIPYQASTQLNMEGALLNLSPYSMDRDYHIELRTEEPKDGSKAYIFGKPYHILFQRAKISLPIAHIEVERRSKAVILYHDGNREISLGGRIEGDHIVSFHNHLGKFYIGFDTSAPTIRARHIKPKYAPGENLHFSISDNYPVSGIAKDIEYHVYINDEPLIASLKSMSGILTVTLPPDLKSGTYLLHIHVTDDRNNKNQYTFTIKI